MSKKYFGNWTCHADVEGDFAYDRNYTPDWNNKRAVTPIPGFPTDEEILFATYDYGDYSGQSTVIFERDGQLYEDQNGHCSCNGLEGSWRPGLVTWEALALRFLEPKDGWICGFSDAPEETRIAVCELIKSRLTPKE